MCKSFNCFSGFVTPVTPPKNSGVTKHTLKKINCHIAFLRFVTLLHLLHRKNNTNLKALINLHRHNDVFRHKTRVIYLTILLIYINIAFSVYRCCFSMVLRGVLFFRCYRCYKCYMFKKGNEYIAFSRVCFVTPLENSGVTGVTKQYRDMLLG